jgi:hypothetical protein
MTACAPLNPDTLHFIRFQISEGASPNMIAGSLAWDVAKLFRVCRSRLIDIPGRDAIIGEAKVAPVAASPPPKPRPARPLSSAEVKHLAYDDRISLRPYLADEDVERVEYEMARRSMPYAQFGKRVLEYFCRNNLFNTICWRDPETVERTQRMQFIVVLQANYRERIELEARTRGKARVQMLIGCIEHMIDADLCDTILGKSVMAVSPRFARPEYDWRLGASR